MFHKVQPFDECGFLKEEVTGWFFFGISNDCLQVVELVDGGFYPLPNQQNFMHLSQSGVVFTHLLPDIGLLQNRSEHSDIRPGRRSGNRFPELAKCIFMRAQGIDRGGMDNPPMLSLARRYLRADSDIGGQSTGEAEKAGYKRLISVKPIIDEPVVLTKRRCQIKHQSEYEYQRRDDSKEPFSPKFTENLQTHQTILRADVEIVRCLYDLIPFRPSRSRFICKFNCRICLIRYFRKYYIQRMMIVSRDFFINKPIFSKLICYFCGIKIFVFNKVSKVTNFIRKLHIGCADGSRTMCDGNIMVCRCGNWSENSRGDRIHFEIWVRLISDISAIDYFCLQERFYPEFRIFLQGFRDQRQSSVSGKPIVDPFLIHGLKQIPAVFFGPKNCEEGDGGCAEGRKPCKKALPLPRANKVRLLLQADPAQLRLEPTEDQAGCEGGNGDGDRNVDPTTHAGSLAAATSCEKTAAFLSFSLTDTLLRRGYNAIP